MENSIFCGCFFARKKENPSCGCPIAILIELELTDLQISTEDNLDFFPARNLFKMKIKFIFGSIYLFQGIISGVCANNLIILVFMGCTPIGILFFS
jgi:hypothetical protein